MSYRRAVALGGVMVLVLLGAIWTTGCEQEEESTTGYTSTSSSTENAGPTEGDILGFVGEEIKAGTAVITVRALGATFQPAVPDQRLSDEAPAAPAGGRSFYQAYVRILNTAVTPIRVDPRHFYCLIGRTMATVDPTRSGPLPRSLLRNASLDLVLTFEGPLGYEPVLIYAPPWYKGIITVKGSRPEHESESTSTTASAPCESSYRRAV